MTNIILAFDTETSGFPPKVDRTKPPVPIADYPHILQLSFVLYDRNKQEIIRTYNEYIKIPDHIQIPEAATRVNGIDKQICDMRGVPIETALLAFCEAYMEADVVVAHNIAFDRKMMEIEVHRNLPNNPHMLSLFNELFNDLHGIRTECTMAMGKFVCDLYVEKNGQRWKKAPKLSELHFHLFGTIPDNLHDALVDTTACLNCYLQMSREPTVPLRPLPSVSK
jgi:DNA polymerase III epsilon subunit-like protein